MQFAIKNLSSMLITAALSVSAVHADDTGFASIHAWRSERGITCMVDHFHSGNGEGRTKKAALRSAIASWEGFTAWEYGTDWARFKSAGSRGVTYTKAGGGWSANVEARPCNRRMRTKRRRRR
ncbi:MAG: hypothetical protein AAGD43_04375 [Pseudomonadota bacterium]